MKHTRAYQQAGFKILLHKAHQPYEFQKILASSSNDGNPKYDLQAVSLGVCTIQTIWKKLKKVGYMTHDSFGREGNLTIKLQESRRSTPN